MGWPYIHLSGILENEAYVTNRMMKALSTSTGMWSAVLCGCAASFIGIALTSRFSVIRSSTILDVPSASWELWILLVLVVTIVTCLTAAPCIRFLATGWLCRLDEFRNRIRDGAVHNYLSQFWEKQLDERPECRTDTVAAEALFATLYVRYNGRRVFAAPVLLLLAATFISAALVVQTGIDTCIDRRCLPSPGTNQATTSTPAATSTQSKQVVAGMFTPLGDITLPLASAAAVAGAFLFVVSDAILRARRCTLNVSDVYWYTLRLVIALPMGLAFTQLAAPTVAGLVAFGLGAFPIDEITKLLRRYTNKSIGSTEEAQEADELVKLNGVTVPIAAAMEAEGIESIDALVGADPVLLALRTGIPFPSILRFGSQAVVRIHLDDRAGQLLQVGLGNAFLINDLIEDLDFQRWCAPEPAEGAVRAPLPAEQRLADAVTVLKKDANATVPSQASIEAVFRTVSKHGYTKFLLSVT